LRIFAYQHNFILYIFAFAIAFGVALLATPFAKKVSIHMGAIDFPKRRGLIKEPIPRMGGLAIVLGFMVTMLVLMPFVDEIRTSQFAGFLAGGIIIVLLGMLDDIYTLGAKVKFCVQIFAALVVVLTGTRIDMVAWPFAAYFEEWLSIPFTMFWIIGVTNAVNFIDGVDGLAAGVASICSVCLMVLCLLTGAPLAVVLTAALAGSCLGFLPRNFNPAEIIMGDTGSTFLGYVLAVSSILGVFKSYAFLAVLIAVLSLALPILDTLFAMLRRLINKKPIMMADRGHLHHRLIDRGYNQKQTVGILYAISAVSGLAAILIAIKSFYATIVVLVFFLSLVSVMYVYKKRTAKGHNSAS
jgi:UDP-GlcNAc:undecaprenyl-phosphate GlcNAc-1-phosphate transferase